MDPSLLTRSGPFHSGGSGQNCADPWQHRLFFPMLIHGSVFALHGAQFRTLQQVVRGLQLALPLKASFKPRPTIPREEYRPVNVTLQAFARRLPPAPLALPTMAPLMRRVFQAAALFLAAVSLPVLAQDDTCVGLIGLSKVTSQTVADSSDVESAARQFCSDYSHHKGDSSGFNFGASYGLLSASLGSSSTSVDDVASHYCDASNNGSAKSDAYRQYVESIAPGAYDAYKTCADSQNDIEFKAQGNTTTEMTLSYLYRANHTDAGWGSLTYASSHDVTCHWNQSKTAVQRSLNGGAGLLSCRRPSPSVTSFVTVIRTDGAGSLNIPWPAYDENNIPIDNLRQITQSLQSLQASVTFNQLPLGTILPYYSKAPVPAGWIACDGSSQCPNLSGLFLRGAGKADALTGQPGGTDKATVHWFGSDNATKDGNGWSKDGDHYISRPADQQIDTVPRYMSVLYIMKVANM